METDWEVKWIQVLCLLKEHFGRSKEYWQKWKGNYFLMSLAWHSATDSTHQFCGGYVRLTGVGLCLNLAPSCGMTWKVTPASLDPSVCIGEGCLGSQCTAFSALWRRAERDTWGSWLLLRHTSPCLILDQLTRGSQSRISRVEHPAKEPPYRASCNWRSQWGMPLYSRDLFILFTCFLLVGFSLTWSLPHLFPSSMHQQQWTSSFF